MYIADNFAIIMKVVVQYNHFSDGIPLTGDLAATAFHNLDFELAKMFSSHWEAIGEKSFITDDVCRTNINIYIW